jgi:hypothetical protein
LPTAQAAVNGIERVSLRIAYTIEYGNDLAALPWPCWSTAVTRRREQVFMRNFAEFGTRVLSDQLSDYRVDDPYIQAHLHGPSSRLVLDSDDSPNVLRDEDVAVATINDFQS